MSRMKESVEQEAGSKADQLRESAAQVQQNLRDMGGQVRDAAQEKFNDLRDQASEYYDQGRERAQAWEHDLESYVQQQPIKSLLIAAGAGMLLGILWRRS
jgi:ElaB/YqjD/DUF883 family membrane-anchored ribosome-binding protein